MKIHGVTYRHPLRNIMDESTASGGAAADTKCYEFDGSTSYMTSTYSWDHYGMNDTGPSPQTGPWTISIWFKITTGTGYQSLIEFRNGTGSLSDMCRVQIGADASAAYSIRFQAYQYGVDQTGGVGVGGSGSGSWFGGPHSTAGGVDPYDGAWHHLAMTCEGVASTGQVKMYYDAVVIGSATQKTSVINPLGIAYLAGDHYPYRFGGRIAQMALFASEFNQTAITGLYNGGSGINPSALSPYVLLRMGDNPGDTTSLAIDEGSSGRNFVGINPGAITIVTDSP